MLLTPLFLFSFVLFFGLVYIGWYLFQPIGFGLQDVYYFSSEIRKKNFRVSKFLSDFEMETLLFLPDELKLEHLADMGIILFNPENNNIFFRREYCIYDTDEISKIFMVFDGFFLMIPYLRSIHYVLLRNGFEKVSSEELFCDESLEFLKKDNTFFNEDTILNFQSNKNDFLIAERFAMLEELQQMMEASIYEIESGRIIPKTDADGVLNYKEGCLEKEKTYYFPF